jgi:hypothetical protein
VIDSKNLEQDLSEKPGPLFRILLYSISRKSGSGFPKRKCSSF